MLLRRISRSRSCFFSRRMRSRARTSSLSPSSSSSSSPSCLADGAPAPARPPASLSLSESLSSDPLPYPPSAPPRPVSAALPGRGADGMPARSSRARWASSRRFSSLAAFSLAAIFCCMSARWRTSSRACRSATNSASENFAKLSLMWTCARKRGREAGAQVSVAYRSERRKEEGGTHVLQAAAVGGEALVEWDRVALVVLPVGDAGRDHPVLLLLGRRLAGRAPELGRRRARRATGDLLCLEPGRLERVLDDLGHLDDALADGRRLRGRVADVGRRPLRVGHARRLGGLDARVGDLLEREPRALGRRHDLVLGRALHQLVLLGQVGPLRDRDEV